MTLVYTKHLKPGLALPNGAIVVACRERSSAREGPPTYFVLAMWLRGRNDCEYVTWVVDSQGEATWGHYFNEDLAAAASDYFDR